MQLATKAVEVWHANQGEELKVYILWWRWCKVFDKRPEPLDFMPAFEVFEDIIVEQLFNVDADAK